MKLHVRTHVTYCEFYKKYNIIIYWKTFNLKFKSVNKTLFLFITENYKVQIKLYDTFVSDEMSQQSNEGDDANEANCSHENSN